ncbi:MAG: DUF3795 domain-containing protein [Candidatus Saccharicenans sp.]|uniref:DUF3795 domain-containing protein n=1 Tax=Candidatus Saccharicenans sp. TaxID=2819258 RepID=UPI00404B6EBF
MAKILAFCGLDCGDCEAYIATQQNDQAGLEETARKWAEQFGATGLGPEMCICDGCSSGGRLSTAHAATCAIRVCASKRGVLTCAHCSDYGCDILQQFFAFAPVLKEKLDAIRKELGK